MNQSIIHKAAAKAAEVLGLPAVKRSMGDALLLVRIELEIEVLVGGSADLMRDWMHGHNRVLGATPAATIETPGGLKKVLELLERYRAG